MLGVITIVLIFLLALAIAGLVGQIQDTKKQAKQFFSKYLSQEEGKIVQDQLELFYKRLEHKLKGIEEEKDPGDPNLIYCWEKRIEEVTKERDFVGKIHNKMDSLIKIS